MPLAFGLPGESVGATPPHFWPQNPLPLVQIESVGQNASCREPRATVWTELDPPVSQLERAGTLLHRALQDAVSSRDGRGRNVAVAEAKVRTASGKLVAVGLASFLIREVG